MVSKAAEYMRKRRKERPDLVIKHNKQRQQKRLENKIKVMNHYSNGTMKCNCCGATGIEFLTLDHINGGGCKERKEINKRPGVDYYAWLLKTDYEDKDLQVLCYNCNCAKQNTGKCPHQK